MNRAATRPGRDASGVYGNRSVLEGPRSAPPIPPDRSDDHLVAVTELSGEVIHLVVSFIDALVRKTRLQVLASEAER